MIEGKFTNVGKYKDPPLNIDKGSIFCACCEKELSSYVVVKEIEQKSSYKFSCPFCNKSSFVQHFYYKVFFEPVNCKIVSIEEGDNVWLVNLKENQN